MLPPVKGQKAITSIHYSEKYFLSCRNSTDSVVMKLIAGKLSARHTFIAGRGYSQLSPLEPHLFVDRPRNLERPPHHSFIFTPSFITRLFPSFPCITVRECRTKSSHQRARCLTHLCTRTRSSWCSRIGAYERTFATHRFNRL